MFPLRDTVPSKNYPIVNNLLIAANIFIYLVEMAQGPNLDRFIFFYGLVPARYSLPELSAKFTLFEQLLPFLSFMFLHGGFLHLLGNVWFLYIFGDNIEDRLGPLRYLAFFLLCGLLSGLSHMLLNWQSPIPTIGASGAIAGVMGAYFILYPMARILTLIPIFFIPYFIEIPAFFFLGIWFLIQFISAAGTPAHGGGIAWWAHIGGFIFGVLLLKAFVQLPATGLSRELGRRTARHTTPRIQMIHPAPSGPGPHLYGSITISQREADDGAQKLINIPRNALKRPFMVTIPPGVRAGSYLRLAGLGRSTDDQRRGDLFLKVLIG